MTVPPMPPTPCAHAATLNVISATIRRPLDRMLGVAIALSFEDVAGFWGSPLDYRPRQRCHLSQVVSTVQRHGALESGHSMKLRMLIAAMCVAVAACSGAAEMTPPA